MPTLNAKLSAFSGKIKKEYKVAQLKYLEAIGSASQRSRLVVPLTI